VRVETETVAAAPPEQVFALYVDASRVPEWRPSIRRIDADGPIEREGTTFTTRYRGLRPPSRGRVMQSKPPHLHVLAGGGPVRYLATLRLESTSTGTRIAFVLEARIPRVLRRRVEDEVRAEIERLARLAAGAWRSSPATTRAARGTRRD
jgi:uncharacterized protein YndB with AHSA1/START domain